MDMKLQTCLYDDLIYEILERLPNKALVRFKSVCKPWKKMIQDPSLALMKLQRPANTDGPKYLNVYHSKGGINNFTAVISNEKIELAVPSNFRHRFECDCIGLYLFYHLRCHHHSPLILFNPLTQEALELPPHASSSSSSSSSSSPHPAADIKKREYQDHIVHGLGFDAGNAVFKVVRLTMDLDNVCRKPEILILGHKSWKQLDLPECLQGIPCRSSSISVIGAAIHCSTLFVNGAIHWLCRRPTASREHHIMIVAFDVMKEEFRPIKFVNLLSKPKDYSLINVEGSLAVCVNDGHHIDIWLLKDYDKGEWFCVGVEKMIYQGHHNYIFTGAWGIGMIYSSGGSYLFFDTKGTHIKNENMAQMACVRKHIEDVPNYQLSLVSLSQYRTTTNDAVGGLWSRTWYRWGLMVDKSWCCCLRQDWRSWCWWDGVMNRLLEQIKKEACKREDMGR